MIRTCDYYRTATIMYCNYEMNPFEVANGDICHPQKHKKMRLLRAQTALAMTGWACYFFFNLLNETGVIVSNE